MSLFISPFFVMIFPVMAKICLTNRLIPLSFMLCMASCILFDVFFSVSVSSHELLLLICSAFCSIFSFCCSAFIIQSFIHWMRLCSLRSVVLLRKLQLPQVVKGVQVPAVRQTYVFAAFAVPNPGCPGKMSFRECRFWRRNHAVSERMLLSHILCKSDSISVVTIMA